MRERNEGALRHEPFGRGFALAVALVALVAWDAGTALADVRGVVATAAGRPVEGVRVEWTSPGPEVPTVVPAWSDPEGRFRVDDCSASPCVLVAVHPRFEVATLDVGNANTVEIVLTAKREVYEEIVVTAQPGATDRLRPPTAAVSTVRPTELAAPSTLTDVATSTPGVDRNGQGGIFQVVSIRGISRQRISTRVAGVPIFGERRAGVSASFLDPGLMQTVEVVRGPASTWYGSGALGGVVQVLPRRFDGSVIESSWDSHGDETRLLAGHGAENWSFALVRRERSDGEAADGTPLNDGFLQWSGAFRFETDLPSERRFDLVVLPSLAEDVGKSSVSFPERVSVYPREEHLVVRAALRSARGWEAAAWIHPNTLETRNLDPETLELVENEAFDLGASWTTRRDLGGRVEARYGVDWTARHGVTAVETSTDRESGAVERSRTLDDARQDELAAFGALTRSFGASTLEAGARWTWHRQSNADDPSRDDSAFTGFVGWFRPVGAGVEVFANLGSGLRFPSLSERFFTGATARGDIVANPDLDPERSLSFDLGARWYGRRAHASVQVFRNEVDDYIERITLPSGARTFVNLTEGTLEGVELEGFVQVAEGWLVRASAHRIDGVSEAGLPLADVPPERLRVGLELDRGVWSGRLGLELRSAKTDPGDSELARSGTELVDLTVSREIRPGLSLTLRGTNLLDRAWFGTADDEAPLEAGRSVGVRLDWAPST